MENLIIPIILENLAKRTGTLRKIIKLNMKRRPIGYCISCNIFYFKIIVSYYFLVVRDINKRYAYLSPVRYHMVRCLRCLWHTYDRALALP